MKLNLTFLAALSVLPLAAVAQPQSDTMSPAVHQEVKKAENMDKPLNDAQIVAIVESANESEIAAGRMEKNHGKSADVKNFAKEMIDHHTDNNKQVKALAKKLHMMPEKTAWTDKMHAENLATAAKMDKLHGADLDRAYVEKQVDMHQHVLDKLDTYLIPQAKNDDLKALLTNTRAAVAQHLQEAKTLQASVNGQTTAPTATTTTTTTTNQ
jgi:putative membrane protein